MRAYVYVNAYVRVFVLCVLCVCVCVWLAACGLQSLFAQHRYQYQQQ